MISNAIPKSSVEPVRYYEAKLKTAILKAQFMQTLDKVTIRSVFYETESKTSSML